MTITQFKKKDPPSEPSIPYGTVVFLNSDMDDAVPMTTSKIENGQVLCRWHDDAGNLAWDYFYPAELHLGEIEEEVVFSPDFEVSADEGA